ncbi:MAG: hypothetical protein A3B99_03550 [Candidatus Yanofskybacteria bacterium RIFCSPHIGHO2_02_FULL_44_12b]|nr:MAG: hypothetical protein A3B99_03550 [Candidatus Yanofskybacteria bacterium RIFCSPHIGHO2_02_FULL_44_12b]
MLYGILIVLLMGLIPYWLLTLWEKSMSNDLEVIAEGVLDRAESDARSFSMAPITKRVAIETTKVYFADGTRVLIGGRPDLPPKGTRIRVSKNKLASYRVELIENRR